MTSITARRAIAAPVEEVFAFLGDLENHWRLSSRFEVLGLERNADGAAVGGSIRVHGPLGLYRTVRTRVLHVDPPGSMRGEAVVDATRAEVAWALSPQGDATTVELSVVLIAQSWRDRMLFTFGGTPWLRRQFRGILEELDGFVGGGEARSDRARPGADGSRHST